MKITLYSESSLGMDLACITEHIMKLAPNLSLARGKSHFKINTEFISAPQTYTKIPRSILDESSDSDHTIMLTGIPYDNNYFWEGVDNKSIISFWGWDYLSNLSLNNGVVFFLCAVVLQHLGIGIRHKDNTGCINDLWMDKTGVDLGMRTGLLCAECLADYEEYGDKSNSEILKQIQAVLNELSNASRSNMDICEFWQIRPRQDRFDVFISYNSEDRDVIREMNGRLKNAGIVTWFDEEQLPPGRLWQELLEEQISQIKTAVVFVGPSGIGPWQNAETRAFLSEFIRRRCPVIPVILADCVQVPKLPIFLQQFTWVDFRKIVPEPFSQLLWGITGSKV